MKKTLLAGAFALGSFLTANAQSSCATALNLPIGTTTVGELTGTYVANCFTGGSANAANWYSYTATANGYLRLNTDLPANDGETLSDDTRISVYGGTCAALECIGASDDVDPMGNFLTNFQVVVISGETYYIAFDNEWNDAGFQVEVSFEEADCFKVLGGFTFVEDPTPTQVVIGWTAAANSPAGYEFLYGPVGFDPEAAGTLIDDITTNQVTVSGLTQETDYEFYVRTNCGEGVFSEWVGPITFSTPTAPTNIPYEFGFEEGQGFGWSALNVTGGAAWSIVANTEALPANSGDAYARVGANGGVSDSWLFSRGLNLTAGTSYTLAFELVKYAVEGAGNVNNLTVTFGTENTVEAQTNTIVSLPNYAPEDYEQQVNDFVAPTTGVYYIGFRYTAPAHAEDNYGFIGLDDVTVTLDLGVNEALASKLTVSPNPTNGVVSIANNENILINGVVMTDINGRTVKTLKFDGVSNTQLNISDLAAGIYMMTISSDNGVATKKVIKN